MVSLDRATRPIKHDTKGFHNFLDIAYCTAHNCYFALQKNNTILVRDYFRRILL